MRKKKTNVRLRPVRVLPTPLALCPSLVREGDVPACGLVKTWRAQEGHLKIFTVTGEKSR